MNNADNAPASTFRFSIRTLMWLTAGVALLVASCVTINRTLNRQFGYGPYAMYDEWPRALQHLLENDKQLMDDVTPFGLSDFIDHSSIWRINAESELRAKLNEAHDLIPASANHPKAAFLIESIPNSWRKPTFDKCKWFVTPGYGTKHIEGLDLFLVLDDPESGETIVLHEWLF
ncbi:MAG: hypothetical protein AAGA30_13020 [Planctomycetota bacterium]